MAAANLARTRQIEIGAEFRKSGNNLRRRISLDRVENRRLWKDGAERLILCPRDVEVDDDARGLWALLGPNKAPRPSQASIARISGGSNGTDQVALRPAGLSAIVKWS